MTLKSSFKKYGREMVLCKNDGWTSNRYFGFIEPLRYKNKMYLNGINTEIGYDSQGHYLYIGPPDHDLSDLDDSFYLVAGKDKFIIDRAERVYKGNQVFYIWAIIRTIVEVD